MLFAPILYRKSIHDNTVSPPELRDFFRDKADALKPADIRAYKARSDLSSSTIWLKPPHRKNVLNAIRHFWIPL